MRLDKSWKSKSDLAMEDKNSVRRELDGRCLERVPWIVVKSLIQCEVLIYLVVSPVLAVVLLVLLLQNCPALWNHLLLSHLSSCHQHCRLPDYTIVTHAIGSESKGHDFRRRLSGP
jgi:hypothetical protein